jgi:hypothetical protein
MSQPEESRAKTTGTDEVLGASDVPAADEAEDAARQAADEGTSEVASPQESQR